MAKSPLKHSVEKPQIVPRGYWTFWFVVYLVSGVGAFGTALYWWPERKMITGFIGIAYGVAWIMFYWRMRCAR